VAKSAPDGYTLMVGYVATHGTNPAVRKVPYDAVKDFTPVAMVGGTPNVLVVHPGVPAKSLAELIDYGKRNAGKLSYGSSGQGSLTHLAMEQFKQATGLDATHAAYRGIGPAITDILGGQTQMMMPGLAAAIPHIKAGKMRPLAVTGMKRHPLIPDVPTFEELGFKGFDGVQWYGIVGPAKMPEAVTKRLNDEINKALAAPALRERLAGEALEPMPMTSAEFGRFIQADITRWSQLARDRKISLEE
jgi:tripartite-type tricarboxylate transporter receptor subunit TctC